MSDKNRSMTILGLSGLIYFVAYPEDAEAMIKPITTVLNLTTAISPFLYGVLAVGIMAIAIIKTWCGRTATSKD